jgi:hypothetical protein
MRRFFCAFASVFVVSRGIDFSPVRWNRQSAIRKRIWNRKAVRAAALDNLHGLESLRPFESVAHRVQECGPAFD